MTTQTIIKLCSAGATGLDAVLAYSDLFKQIPGISPDLAHASPFIFLLIVAVDRGLHAFLGDPAPVQAGSVSPVWKFIPNDSAAGKFDTATQGTGPVNPAPVGPLPDPQAFRQPLGQPQKPSA